MFDQGRIVLNNRQKLKAAAQCCIDEYAKGIIDIGEAVYSTPETGYKEYRTVKYMENVFRGLGLEYVKPEGIPGFKATVDTGKPGPGIAVMGELDAIICPQHPHSSRETGAVHACGHNVQLAAVAGAATGLVNSGVINELSGKIHFIAVPAEECIELDYRKNLRKEGLIRYFAGKQEFIYRGLLDDVDICMLLHAYSISKKIAVNSTNNGCIIKKARYRGKASHAGGAPHNGINSLYAANLALNAINSLRETFREKDYIRVHPIITKGGDAVNVIPDDVRIETYIRGKTIEVMLETNKKVNRALAGSAVAMGAEVEIEDIPGYLPLNNEKKLMNLVSCVGEEIAGEDVAEMGHSTASTDMGDLSSLMPVLQSGIGGVLGGLHTGDFRIIDANISYVLGSKLLACMAIELLYGDAAIAGEILDSYNPVFNTKEDYIKFLDSLSHVSFYSYKDMGL